MPRQREMIARRKPSGKAGKQLSTALCRSTLHPAAAPCAEPAATLLLRGAVAVAQSAVAGSDSKLRRALLHSAVAGRGDSDLCGAVVGAARDSVAQDNQTLRNSERCATLSLGTQPHSAAAPSATLSLRLQQHPARVSCVKCAQKQGLKPAVKQ